MGSLGFSYRDRKDGTVVVLRDGAAVTVLRGGRAAQFLDEVAGDEDHAQQVMARWTGNYRRGNERTARNHPRNSGR
ncbi:hypothetical protein [Actinotalea sp. C106]|uniref:hypothetical protein n=1 Tax=Actinotalea sp. C106 TaxID=2908644 RepID=UPI0020298586|nr:hypothetical protein [Actinotalea sp. C106]